MRCYHVLRWTVCLSPAWPFVRWQRRSRVPMEKVPLTWYPESLKRKRKD